MATTKILKLENTTPVPLCSDSVVTISPDESHTLRWGVSESDTIPPPCSHYAIRGENTTVTLTRREILWLYGVGTFALTTDNLTDVAQTLVIEG